MPSSMAPSVFRIRQLVPSTALIQPLSRSSPTQAAMRRTKPVRKGASTSARHNTGRREPAMPSAMAKPSTRQTPAVSAASRKERMAAST